MKTTSPARQPPSPPPAAAALPPPPAPPSLSSLSFNNPVSLPPPPPPPPLFSSLPKPTKKSKLPKPSQPLKSFNWSKLMDYKSKGTIWEQLNISYIVPHLTFHEIDKTFSAYQRKETNKDETDGNCTPQGSTNKPKELAFIDHNRSRNCEIILKKMNLENSEISAAVLAMDPGDILAKDMIEQMMKYIPTADEAQLFNTHIADVELFARADRYLYEMSKISHFEERLSALCYKKSFTEKISEIRPKIECVIRSCRQVSHSKRLRTLLEVILCLGNYMNTGSRGNALGFRISSLNKLMDTKSSVDKGVTLLNYLLELLYNKFPLVFNLQEELPDVKNAAKITHHELTMDISNLRKGMTGIEKELQCHSKSPHPTPTPNDHFLYEMGNFVNSNTRSIEELEKVHGKMVLKLQKTIALFGENKNISGDEFFGNFRDFLVSFEEAKCENVVKRKMKQEEARKANLAEKKDKDRQLRAMSEKMILENLSEEEKCKSLSGRHGNLSDVDELISALKTGDLFGDELSPKGRRRHTKARNITSATSLNKMSIISEADRDRQKRP